MVYTTATNVKSFAKITYDQLGYATDAAYGTFLTNTLIPRAEYLIDNYVGHDFNANSGTIRLDGNGKEALPITRMGLVGLAGGALAVPRLLPLPLRSVSSISVDSSAISGYKVYDAYVVYEDNTFCIGRQNVDIVGSWGYGSVPTDIHYVAEMICANALRNQLKRWLAPQEITRIVMGGRSTGGMRGFYAEDIALTDGLKMTLDHYRFDELGVG